MTKGSLQGRCQHTERPLEANGERKGINSETFLLTWANWREETSKLAAKEGPGCTAGNDAPLVTSQEKGQLPFIGFSVSGDAV